MVDSAFFGYQRFFFQLPLDPRDWSWLASDWLGLRERLQETSLFGWWNQGLLWTPRGFSQRNRAKDTFCPCQPFQFGFYKNRIPRLESTSNINMAVFSLFFHLIYVSQSSMIIWAYLSHLDPFGCFSNLCYHVLPLFNNTVSLYQIWPTTSTTSIGG